MKNKTAYIISGTIALFCGVYFCLLLSTDFSLYPSFSDCWIILAVLFGALFFKLKKEPAKEKFRPLKKFPQWIRITIAAVLLLCVLIATINLAFICTPKTADSSEETSYLIVLGGGIKQNATLGATPRKRIEKAAIFLKQHPQTKVIVTGGKGDFAPCAEAPILAEYLSSLGISNDRILQEDKARDTIQNFYLSAQLIAQDQNISLAQVLKQPITVVTSKFHLRRSLRLAKRMGFTQVNGLASKTPALFVINSYCREICSYIKLNLRIWFTKQPQPIA